jgi:hypothetical protein
VFIAETNGLRAGKRSVAESKAYPYGPSPLGCGRVV